MRILALLLAGALLSAPLPALADRDHDDARRAVEEGQVLPLRRILDTVEARYDGRVLEVELENKHDRWVYEVKLLASDGRILVVKLDAATAEVLAEKGARPDRRGRN